MSLCRLLFLLFNYSYFNEYSFTRILSSFYFGLRFDLTAISILTLPFSVLHLVPFALFYNRAYQFLLKFLFFTAGIFMLLLNCIDIGLFRFAGKRATADLLSIMSFGEDFTNTVPGMLRDFWYLSLLLLLLIFLLVYLYHRISIQKNPVKHVSAGSSNKFFLLFSHLFFLALIFIGFRGGIQYKPINILSAAKYGTGQYSSLVLNSPFTFIKTLGKKSLQEASYFEQGELEKIYPTLKTAKDSSSFRAENVVIIILESIGTEYIGKFNREKGYTPFLDSLIDHSLVFPHTFANGKRSIEGIPAIVSGIPALMPEPFITSAYAGNSFESIASLLKKKGYSAFFYHGGTNGTMGFDNFCRSAGFDLYYGRKEYGQDKDFDGTWGIYDEPFLLRMAQNLDKVDQPFLSVLFTLSSHHPYSIPQQLEGKFRAGTLPIHKSVQYTDYSLRSFFNVASKKAWYPNTLFVITTDHTALSEKSFYQNRIGMYSIPQLYFKPDGSLKGRNEKVSQQIDILPSIMDYLNYDKDYFAFGNSVFNTDQAGFSVNYINDTYQYIEGNYSLIMDTLQGNSMYNYSKDRLLRTDLISTDSLKAKLMETKLKAIIQKYNSSLINNRMIY